jgi:hypothetical protein
MARAPRIKSFMGRKQFRGSHAGGSEQALNADFRASMDDLLGNLQEFIDHMEDVKEDVLIEALEPTFGKALEYCPIDKGNLRKSGYLESRTSRGRAEVEIGFARGGDPHYAIYVHEIPAYHEPPTSDKFLEKAIAEDYFSIISSLPRLVREAAGT